MTRARTAVLAVITCAALGGLAAAARAGDNHVSNPHDIDSCGTLNIPGGMTAPNEVLTFLQAGPEGCVKLCKQAEKECKNFVKRVSTCRMDFYKDQESYDVTSCQLFFHGSDVKNCKRSASTDRQNSQDSEKANVKVAQTACNAWETSCSGFCNQP